jgi:molecular chaperone HscB
MTASYFALLGVPARFALPAAQLDLAYRALAARVHPDRHVQATPAARREAEMLAANANEAYRTLRQPLLRAQHLLGLRGIAALERGGAEAPAFLMQQVEWREALEEARVRCDAAALAQLAAEVRARATALQADIALHLDTQPDDDAAAAAIRQLAYVEKLAAAIDDAAALEG